MAKTYTHKQLPELMRKLKNHLRNKVFSGAAEAYNYEIIQYFESHPSGVGYTLLSFKPVSVSGTKTMDIIARFGSGVPALMQLGPDGAKGGYSYPYNKDTGTFISFMEEPRLEEWARKNIPSLNTNAKGLFVGRRGRTGYGKKYNRWVDITGMALKKSQSTRDIMLKHLRTISF